MTPKNKEPGAVWANKKQKGRRTRPKYRALYGGPSVAATPLRKRTLYGGPLSPPSIKEHHR
jgi:hypothetical protein